MASSRICAGSSTAPSVRVELALNITVSPARGCGPSPGARLRQTSPSRNRTAPLSCAALMRADQSGSEAAPPSGAGRAPLAPTRGAGAAIAGRGAAAAAPAAPARRPPPRR
jgi:hypothetical protein